MLPKNIINSIKLPSNSISYVDNSFINEWCSLQVQDSNIIDNETPNIDTTIFDLHSKGVPLLGQTSLARPLFSDVSYSNVRDPNRNYSLVENLSLFSTPLCHKCKDFLVSETKDVAIQCNLDKIISSFEELEDSVRPTSLDRTSVLQTPVSVEKYINWSVEDQDEFRFSTSRSPENQSITSFKSGNSTVMNVQLELSHACSIPIIEAVPNADLQTTNIANVLERLVTNDSIPRSKYSTRSKGPVDESIPWVLRKAI